MGWAGISCTHLPAMLFACLYWLYWLRAGCREVLGVDKDKLHDPVLQALSCQTCLPAGYPRLKQSHCVGVSMSVCLCLCL